MDVRDLRTEIDAWVSATYPGGVYADGGGQRLVYKVPSKSAALKIWALGNAAQLERHVREVDALQQIEHPSLPNVVNPIDQIEIDGEDLSFYLEEWLDAPSLRSQIDDVPFELDRVRHLAGEWASAVRALHDANIVHRDISLGNVLAGADSGFVIDLGLSKHLALDTLTGTGEFLRGTRDTASPEQLQGFAADLRAPTDIYSLGMVMAYALTGRNPYLDENEMLDLGTYVRRQLAEDIRHLPPTDIGDLIESMLSSAVFYRPTAAAVCEALS